MPRNHSQPPFPAMATAKQARPPKREKDRSDGRCGLFVIGASQRLPAIALSSEVDAGSREENASKQKAKARSGKVGAVFPRDKRGTRLSRTSC
jgi:hypothetical protein